MTKDGNLPKSARLWHGTYETDPEIIYNGVGLNINYAANGYWGKAIYFAVNANYSCPGYSFKVKPVELKQYEVFCANVIIGNEFNAPGRDETTRQWKEPPFIEGTNVRYDSVKGFTADGRPTDSDVYMVYTNTKTYPGLLVRYQL